MQADPFSDLLEVTSAQSVVTGGLRSRRPWAVRFAAPTKLKFFAQVVGTCFVLLDGDDAAHRVEAGDVFLLAERRAFLLGSDLDARPIEADDVVVVGNDVDLGTDGDGPETFLMGGHVELDAGLGGLLSDVMPPWIHVTAASPEAPVLHWLVDQLVQERSTARPGSGLASEQLAQLMFVQLLRAHLGSGGEQRAGLLRAIGDARLAPALRLMHSDPARAWRVDELASAAAMSRTTFAVHFKAVAGIAPLAYLTEWRMRLAEKALRDDSTRVAELGRSLGYGSESAFSNAFKRVTGSAPRHYRLAARAAAQ